MDADAKMITEKLVSKISHDFAGTIGALSNALEYVFDVEEIEVDNDTKEVLTGGIDKLSGYLQLLRVALGVDFSHDAIPVDRLRKILINLGRYYHSEVIFDRQISSYYSTNATRVLCLWLLIIFSFITKGTKLIITQTEQGYKIEYQGQLYAKAQEYLTTLDQDFEIDDLNSDNIFLFQLKYMIKNYEMVMNIDTDHDSYLIITI